MGEYRFQPSSFPDGLLEYPQYTRPQMFEGAPIPELLLSGDHARELRAWRRAEAEALTRAPAARPLRHRPAKIAQKAPTDG